MKIAAACLLIKVIIFFADFAVAQKIPNCQASNDLSNLDCININLYREAQPNSEGIAELAKWGIKQNEAE